MSKLPPNDADIVKPGDDASANNGDAWLGVTSKIRDGDPAALERLYLHFFDLVLREIRIVTGRDESTCLDLTQDTFLNILRRMRPIRDERKLRGWVRAVARTTCFDWMRCRARELRHIASSVEQGPARLDGKQPDEPSVIETLTDLHARSLILQRELSALPAEIRELMSLRYRLGWTLSRIGERLGKKPGAVDGQIRRTIEKLRAQMKGLYDE